jgi:hypothetical protein
MLDTNSVPAETNPNPFDDLPLLATLEKTYGRAPVPAEIKHAQGVLMMARSRGAVEEFLGLGDIPDFSLALDPLTFVEQHSRVEPLWGIGDERPYWASGEALILVGADGTHKTTIGQGLALRQAGIWHDPCLLGLKVRRVDGPVLYLALDRPAQQARSLTRFTSRLDNEALAMLPERLVVWSGPLPGWVGSTPNGLTDFVAALGDERGCSFGATIIDNVSDLYGNLADTDIASVAGQSVNRCASAGIETAALHHQRKRDTKSKKYPESIDDIYGGRMFTKATGTVLGLHRVMDSDDAPLTVTHLKAPLGFRGKVTVIPELATGDMRMLPAALHLAALEGSVDPLVASVAKAIKILTEARSSATVAEVFEVVSERPHDRSKNVDRARYEAIRRALESLRGASVVGKRGSADLWKWSNAA